MGGEEADQPAAARQRLSAIGLLVDTIRELPGMFVPILAALYGTRNSDIGGHHIAFYVEDINAAAAYLKEKGIRSLMGPIPVSEGPAAGQSILYFFAPWGLQMEAISFPQGMAYEKDGGPVLWSNIAPAN